MLQVDCEIIEDDGIARWIIVEGPLTLLIMVVITNAIIVVSDCAIECGEIEINNAILFARLEIRLKIVALATCTLYHAIFVIGKAQMVTPAIINCTSRCFCLDGQDKLTENLNIFLNILASMRRLKRR